MSHTIQWCAEDIAACRPEWTEDQCESWLAANFRHIQDRSIQAGWETIECLLSLEEDKS